jgi:ribonuclease HI
MKCGILACFDGGGKDCCFKTYGVTLVDDHTNKTLHSSFGNLPNIETYNEAEWWAARIAMNLCWAFRDVIDKVTLQGDSQLVIKQCLGEYVCQAPHLIVHKKDVLCIRERLESQNIPVKFNWVPREQNERADALGRMAE